ncbi:Flp pilus assembly protein CpaB [Nocardioides sp. CFH 31398]|uniref:Flp pilus assembly protein CpaB n=1 Tax=Nocardioides sp. CFH 31398 TaxID=2919579 RepID=UPI001F06DCC9|nr:Flp pilus assembly protein CpaB [Nocardioides sp. CFH 31398]MCH1868226.1 Flp pilus assembly protein CpaB [Nocardioides sp. CFH 31398]
MNRRRLLLAAATVVAAIGVMMVLVYVRGADARAQEGTRTVPVLTAVAPIEIGEAVGDAYDAGKIVTTVVPADAVLPSAQTDVAALEGLFATTRIFPGEQIITEKFGGQQETSSPLAIPRDKMAASVNLTDPARVAGFVNPGSEVAVVYTGQGEDGAPFSRVLFERVQVLGVGSTTPTTTTTTTDGGAETTEQLPTTLMTLSLDQDEVQRMTFAAANGELSFALLTEDSDVEAGESTDFSNLFGG